LIHSCGGHREAYEVARDMVSRAKAAKNGIAENRAVLSRDCRQRERFAADGAALIASNRRNLRSMLDWTRFPGQGRHSSPANTIIARATGERREPSSGRQGIRIRQTAEQRGAADQPQRQASRRDHYAVEHHGSREISGVSDPRSLACGEYPPHAKIVHYFSR
jgi:hypothetical protein